MDNDKRNTSNSNSNWLALLRRKIQKKFKKVRRKSSEVENSPSVENLEEIQSPEIPIAETSTANVNPMNSLTAQDCEEMKKELFKLTWYWPALSRVDAQKILSSKANGSFLVRDSSEKDSFTLSFRTNSKTFHCRNQW